MLVVGGIDTIMYFFFHSIMELLTNTDYIPNMYIYIIYIIVNTRSANLSNV